MISLEKLTKFAHQNLRYKTHIKVVSYKILNNWIDLRFNNFKGEVVSVDRFYNWLAEKRQQKLDNILK